MTTQHQPVSGVRITVTGYPKCRVASAQHQFIECESEGIRRIAFQPFDVIGGPNGVWYTYRVFLHVMVHHVKAPRSQSVSAKY
ncbi:Uncharacterised protein [Salmonella enterica subsp. enterica serovar Bovismorbificans]|uniref:Uncharacterized protein n=1 Tax=Salmonella enterica subsp. enterica serovar Bovismorbificans TaxID=58097 RepID=A0A655EK43_SALET|nr:Uncharacterised protein [Salmonella enterica subsp. enterica serovar Bovismorbificans]